MRTTVWAGCGFVLAGVVHLLRVPGASVSFERGADLPVSGPPYELIADVLLLASTIVLALGAPREQGVAGPSTTARTALVLFGAQGVVFAAEGVLPQLPLGIALAVQTLLWAAGLVAGTAVARAGVLHGWSRWSLLVLAIVNVIAFAAQFSLATLLLWAPIAPVADVLLVATGVGYFVAGRTAAIRARVASARAQW